MGACCMRCRSHRPCKLLSTPAALPPDTLPLLPFPLTPCPCCPPPDAEQETFYREAALLSRLHHRNIVQVQWAVRWALGGV